MFYDSKSVVFAFTVLLSSPALWAAGSHAGGHHAGSAHGAAAHAGGGHAASAVGMSGEPSQVTRTIEVQLLDSMRFAFTPALRLQHGDVVRFVVHNRGEIRHEFSIGNAAEQRAHRLMMQKMPDMVHEDSNSVTVEPGQTRELVWRFSGEEPVVFACNIPGHAEAGMTASTNLDG